MIEDPAKSNPAPFRTGKNDSFDNRLISGDNLLALKTLEQEFREPIQIHDLSITAPTTAINSIFIFMD